MIQAIKDAKEKVIGLKQTLRAILQERIVQVYYATDLEEHILRKITTACEEYQIPLLPTKLSQEELGRFCQIEVGAAVIGILK